AQTQAVVDVWQAQEPDLLSAVTASMTTGDVAACDDVDSLVAVAPLPREPAARARALALQQLIDTSGALRQAGKFEAGLSLARDALTQARALGHVPTLAEALHNLALAEGAGGHSLAAIPLLEESARLAGEAHDDVRLAK